MPHSTVQQIQIMISSTRADLGQYREAASQIIQKVAAEKEKHVQLVEVSMEKEYQSGDREPPISVSKGWVEKADWIVLIVAWNYGTISNEVGADGLSVTEWEYKHAVKNSKKIFVFIAGYPGTADSYTRSAEEQLNLTDWWMIDDRQTADQREKLRNFKQVLGEKHLDLFKDLPTFRIRLEQTLRRKIDDLPPVIKPGGRLEELLIKMQPDMRNCIRKVKLIAVCKRIHDYLHELRHYVIRPLQDEESALLEWSEDGTLLVSGVNRIWSKVSTSRGLLGSISEAYRSIDSVRWQLQDSVNQVLQYAPLWTEETPGMNKHEFTAHLEGFADIVQYAFMQADGCMTSEERDLSECYQRLRENLNQAKQTESLDPIDKKQVEEELAKIEASKSRVRTSLEIHHEWQTFHDQLHLIDIYSLPELFNRDLKRFQVTSLLQLLKLVDAELNNAKNNQQETTESAPYNVSEILQPPLQQPSLGVSDMHRAFLSDLQQLQELLNKLRHEDSGTIFKRMCGNFDNAFYFVDKRTLAEVNSADLRAKNLEKLLDNLGQKGCSAHCNSD